MIRIAKLYYEVGMSQEQIASREYISASSVSRILKKAVELKYVTFSVKQPIHSVGSLEQRFLDLFPVERVYIVPAYVENLDIRMGDTCKLVAEMLNTLINDDEIISLSWGRTLEYLAGRLVSPERIKKNIRVVLLSGALTNIVESVQSIKIVEQFCENYMGKGYIIPTPILVDSAEIAHAIRSDMQVQRVLNMAGQSQLAIFAVGQTGSNLVMVERGALSEKEQERILSMGAVGVLCGHFYNVFGEIVSEEYENRCISISANNLRRKKRRIGIAVGKEKVYATIGALKAGFISDLFIDEQTARRALNACKKLGI